MRKDYISGLEYRGVISRIKRLADSTIADGRKLYRYINIGIEPNWFLIFGIIIEKGETSISEISSILKFAHPSVITIVKKMEKAGYLIVKPSPIDKRKQIIKLSELAEAQLPEMQKIWNACELAMQSVFVDDNFLKELDKMEVALESESFFDRVLNNLGQDDIRIEPFIKSDSKHFASLNYEWLDKYFDIEPIDKIVLGNPIKHIIEKGGSILMARYRDQTVGTVALLPKGESEAELTKMAVHSAHQGKGIGQRMMKAAIELAKKKQYSDVFLYSNRRLKPAIKLYLKNKFVEEPLESNIVYERSDIKMRLKL